MKIAQKTLKDNKLQLVLMDEEDEDEKTEIIDRL